MVIQGQKFERAGYANILKTTTVRPEEVWGNDMYSPCLPTKSEMSSSAQIEGSLRDIQKQSQIFPPVFQGIPIP